MRWREAFLLLCILVLVPSHIEEYMQVRILENTLWGYSQYPVGTVLYFRLEGNSMYPTLPSHGTTLICVRQVDYNVGDIVTYVPSPELEERFVHFAPLVTHRIVAEVDGWYVLWGDNNPVPDGVVPQGRMICKAVGYCYDSNGECVWLQ